MYNSVEELLERAKTENKRLHEVIAQNEMSISDISEEMLYDRLEKHYQTMVASAAKAVNAPQDMPGVDFIKGQSLKQAQYSESQTLGGSYLNNIMTMALSCCEVNAGMGRICAAPTAGACGILPAVLIETSRKLNSTKRKFSTRCWLRRALELFLCEILRFRARRAAVRRSAEWRQPLRRQPQFILREEQPPCAQTRLPLPS